MRTLVFAWALPLLPLFVSSVARADDPAPLPLLPSSVAAPAPAAPVPPASAPAAPVKVAAESDTGWGFTMCNGIDTKAVRVSTGCTGVLGLRGSVSHVDRVPANEGAGLMFSAEGEEYWRRGIFNSRGQYRAALGGGAAGLEGALLGAFAFGFRAPVTENQGPVVRAGAYGYLLGNDAFTSSLIELPQLQLGWQWSRGHAVFEIAGTTGVALTGRFRAGEAAARDIGQGFSFGGHASVQAPWVRVSLEAERLPTNDSIGMPVDVVSGTLCAVASPVAICADARAMQARAFVAGAEPMARVAYAGLTLGFTGGH